MFKAYIKALLDLVKRAAFPSNTLTNISYTGGDVGGWGTFFSYTPTADGYFRIGAESKETDSALQIYSGNYAQTIDFSWVGEGKSLTVPCTKGLLINCIGNDLTDISIYFIPSLGSNN